MGFNSGFKGLNLHIIHQILIKLKFYQQIFAKSSNREFYRNPSSGSQVVPCRLIDRQTDRQTDTHDKANSRFLQFCEHAQNEYSCSFTAPCAFTVRMWTTLPLHHPCQFMLASNKCKLVTALQHQCDGTKHV